MPVEAVVANPTEDTTTPEEVTSNNPTLGADAVAGEATDGEEVLDVTPPENEQAAQTADTVPAETVQPRQWTPTAQQVSLGGEFENLDMRLYNAQIYRTKGEPTITQEKRIKKVKVSGTPEVRDEAGNVTTPAVPDSTKDEEETVNVVSHTWDMENKELLGEPMPSLTAALRLQKGIAKELEKEGYSVKEYISKEYGVWYATDPNGKKPGYRYTIMPVAAPIKPPKPVKEAKPPKPPKPPKAEKDPNAPKTSRAKSATAKVAAATPAEAAASAAAQSDPVEVEIAE